MNNAIQKLEMQVKGLELEKERLISARKTSEVPTDVSAQIRSLNRRIWRLKLELGESQRDPSKYSASSGIPNPVELMFTWCDIFFFVAISTWFCDGLLFYLYGENVATSALLAALILLTLALPVILALALLKATRRWLGEILPTYYCSDTLFIGNGIVEVGQRCWRYFNRNMCLTTILSMIVLASDIACFFVPKGFILPHIGIFGLSIGGSFIIIIKTLSDITVESRKARQVL